MWPYSLRNHFERKHGAVKVTTTSGFGLFEKNSNENTISNSNEKKSLIHCQDCDYKSPYKANVRRHSASKHSLVNKEKKQSVSRITEYRTKKKLFNDIKDDEYMKNKFKNLKKLLGLIAMILLR